MTTDEKLNPRTIFISIILGLIFCSYVVSYKVIDLLYLFMLFGAYMNYKMI